MPAQTASGNFPAHRLDPWGDADPPKSLSRAFEQYLNRPGWRLMATRILVVEKNQLNMKLYRDLLEVLGHTVDSAVSVEQADRIVRIRRPDMVVAAIGNDLLAGRTLRDRLKAVPGAGQIPFVALVDPLPPAHRLICADDFDGILTTPAPLAAFLRVLEMVLGSRLD